MTEQVEQPEVDVAPEVEQVKEKPKRSKRDEAFDLVFKELRRHPSGSSLINKIKQMVN